MLEKLLSSISFSVEPTLIALFVTLGLHLWLLKTKKKAFLIIRTSIISGILNMIIVPFVYTWSNPIPTEYDILFLLIFLIINSMWFAGYCIIIDQLNRAEGTNSLTDYYAVPVVLAGVWSIIFFLSLLYFRFTPIGDLRTTLF